MSWFRPAPRLVTPTAVSLFRTVGADRAAEYRERGFHRRHFFAHRAYYVPRAGPDGLQLAKAMYGVSDPARLKQVLVFAGDEARAGIPPELFFDDDLVWHRQQLGLPGLVAGANVAVVGRELLTTARYSDIVQRIGRRREHATRVEKRFRGWDHMLLNAVLNYAVERNLKVIRFPTADLALAHTDPKRNPKRDMFERIYDADVQARFTAVRRGQYWIVDVRANRDRLVVSAPGREPLADERTICICHDTERELGHLGLDPAFVAHAAAASGPALLGMLEIEGRRGVRATYDVVGQLMPELRPAIEHGGHEIAFHSYDHRPHHNQLGLCRGVDYRVRGYRPPNSRMTPELTDEILGRYNFEWLASSPDSVGTRCPALGRATVRIPIFFDDFPMHRHGVTYDAWEAEALQTTASRPFTAFGLHDCYADHWLHGYEALLGRLADLGTLRTVGEVADRVLLGCAE